MSEIICRSISNGREFEVSNNYFRSLHALKSECNSYTLAEERYKELLAEHDNQIRAEVLDELFNTEITNGMTLKEVYEEVPINEFDEGWDRCYEDFAEITKQLKETKNDNFKLE